MSTIVVGECLGVTTRQAGNAQNSWEETIIVVLDSMRVEQVPVASVEKFRGELPTAGEVVALDVKVRAFARREGGTGYAFTAFGRVPSIESALPAHQTAATGS